VLQACRKIVVVRRCTAYRSPLQIKKQTENKLIQKKSKEQTENPIYKINSTPDQLKSKLEGEY
jgi:hypothetical protein